MTIEDGNNGLPSLFADRHIYGVNTGLLSDGVRKVTVSSVTATCGLDKAKTDCVQVTVLCTCCMFILLCINIIIIM